MSHELPSLVLILSNNIGTNYLPVATSAAPLGAESHKLVLVNTQSVLKKNCAVAQQAGGWAKGLNTGMF